MKCGQVSSRAVIYTIVLIIVRKLQAAILARSSREMSQTVRILSVLFESQFDLGLLVGSNFVISSINGEKHPKDSPVAYHVNLTEAK